MKKKVLIIIIFVVLSIVSICLFMFLSNKSTDDLKQNIEDKNQSEIKDNKQEAQKQYSIDEEEKKKTIDDDKQEKTKDSKEQKQESKKEQKVEQPQQKQEIQSVQNQEPVVDTKQKARDYISSYGVKYFTTQSSAQSYLNSIPADIRPYFSVSSRTYKCSVTVTPITDEYGGEGYTSDYYYDAGTYNWFGPKQSINLDGQTTTFVNYCDSHYGLRDSEESKSYNTTFYKVDL